MKKQAIVLALSLAVIAPSLAFADLTTTSVTVTSSVSAQIALLQAQIRPLVNAVFSAKNPIPLAYLFNTAVRLPLVDLEMIDLARKGQPSIRHEIDDIMSRYTPEQLGIDLKKYKNS